MKLFPLKFCLFNASILFGLLVTESINAEIIPDNTLPNNSVITYQDKIISIEGGTREGNNLFHSFKQFSVRTGETASFENISEIQNIFSRITGGKKSQIDGTIQAHHSANLFLINPNGIIFGKNALLNIGGSFFASTADKIVFDDGREFSATYPQDKPLLSITAPTGLGFESNPGSIVNLSRVSPNGETNAAEEPIGLKVRLGQTLALVGGDVKLVGGNLTAPGGRIEIGSVAGNSLVNLTHSIEQGWILDYKNIQNFQNISLTEAAAVDTSSDRGGDVQIQGKNVTFSGNAQVFSITFEAEKGGTLAVDASESVDLSGDFTGLLTLADGLGNAGNLTINTKKLIIQGGSNVASFASESDRGQAGDLTVNATESIKLIGGVILDGQFVPSSISTQGDIGDGGNLTVITKQLLIQNGAAIDASTFAQGKAGDLTIVASDAITLIGRSLDNEIPSGIFAQVAEGVLQDAGDAGDLTITTGRLIIRDGAQISTAARSEGKGGDLTINASKSILLSETSSNATLTSGSSGIFVSAEPAVGRVFTTANAGTLTISTNLLTLEKGAKISADNFGTDIGGNITLNLNRLVVQDGGLIGAGSLDDGVTPEQGAGGILTVNASESVEISGTGKLGDSSLFTKAEGTGNAGDLIINTPLLTVRDGAEITAKATGAGQAGNITVNNANIIKLDRGTITASTNSGEGGEIFLNVNNLLLMNDNSKISAEANNQANGGNVTINAPFIIAFPNQNNDIIAKAQQGDGGRITINNQRIFGLQERKSTPANSTNDIDASSDFGNNGTVEIIAPEVDPTSGVLELPSSPVDAESLIAKDVCRIEDGKIARGSSFIITGKGGLPPTSEDPLINSHRMVEWETIAEERGNSTVTLRQRTQTDERGEKTYPVIQQAQGWKLASDGTLLLTAQATTPTPQSPEGVSPHCQAR